MSNWYESREISAAAEKFATKSYIDEKEKEAFAKGVNWALQRFISMISQHPMEHGSVLTMMDKYRLKDFKKIVEHMIKTKEEKLQE